MEVRGNERDRLDAEREERERGDGLGEGGTRGGKRAPLNCSW